MKKPYPLITFVFKHLGAAAILLIALSYSSTAFAAVSTSTEQATISTVSIHAANAQLSGGILTVTFALQNSDTAQPDIRYGIDVLSTQKGTPQQIVDTSVANETLSLSANQSIGRSISYPIPPYLSGTYQIVIEARTSSGLPLGVAFAGKIIVPASNQGYATILPSTCFLTVGTSTTHYLPQQRIGVSSTDILRATCQVQSHFTSVQTLSPVVETFYQSQFGQMVTAAPSAQQGSVFSPGALHSVSFLLLVPQMPQLYEAKLSFADSAGSIVSNPTFFLYQVSGPSATIEDLVLDKDMYARGDVATATVTWTLSPDFFSGSTAREAYLGLSLVDGKGFSCAAPVSQTITSSSSIQIVVPMQITATCISPTVTASITDGTGNVYAHKMLIVISAHPPINTLPWSKANTELFAFILVLLILLGAFFALKHGMHHVEL